MVRLVKDCSNSIASALELLQSYIKPSIFDKIVQGIYPGNSSTLVLRIIVEKVATLSSSKNTKPA